MTDSSSSNKRKKIRTIIASLAGVVVVGAVIGVIYWTTACPCDRMPGAYLFGEKVEQPINDWSFTNQVTLCQVQIWAGIRPHAINLNCMSTADGKLYLSCSVCDTKYWASKVGPDAPGRLRLDGKVYPVTLNRVLDPIELDRAWAARVAKLQSVGGPGNPAPPEDARRDERWWSFNLVSAI